MDTTQNLTAMQAAVAEIVKSAHIGMDITGTTNKLEALVIACKGAVNESAAARHRQGKYRFEGATLGTVLEDLGFRASVARDIMDGRVSRPSTGNVRDYAMGLM